MKTKYLIFGLVACFILSLSSCKKDVLDVPRHGAQPIDAFYKTDVDATAALATVYSYVWTTTYSNSLGIYPFLKNIMSDDFYSGGQKRNDQPNYEGINEFNFASNNPYVLSYFQGLYNLVYRCNLIISNFTGTNLDTDVKKAAVAQAKVWRAWAYTELITLWGTPPLVDHPLSPSEYIQENGDPVKLWALVELDLTDAISSGYLAEKGDVTSQITTVTKQYAQSLLGKAYIFMTYSLAGGAYGGSQAEAAVAAAAGSPYWAKAATVLDEVINSGKYALYTGPYVNILKRETNWSSENMWEFNRIFNSASTATNLSANWESFMIGWDGPRMTGYGTLQECTRASNFMQPTREVYDAMVAWEGSPNGARIKGSILTYAQVVSDLKIAMNNGTVNSIYSNDGVFDMKEFRDESKEFTSHATDKHYPLMRYSEVLLLAAEANLMAANQAKADNYMNQVRTRAGLASISGITLSDIQQEKRCELYFEGARQYDIIRWGIAYDLLKDKGKTVPYFTAYTASVTGAGSADVVIDSRYTGTATLGGVTYELGVKDQTINTIYGFIKGKHELLPFPQQEILLSGKIVGGLLVQNPGW